jgi:hypothetical protein
MGAMFRFCVARLCWLAHVVLTAALHGTRHWRKPRIAPLWHPTFRPIPKTSCWQQYNAQVDLRWSERVSVRINGVALPTPYGNR